MFLGLKSVAKDLKMDLGRVVVITAKSKSENSLSFRAPIGAARRGAAAAGRSRLVELIMRCCLSTFCTRGDCIKHLMN